MPLERRVRRPTAETAKYLARCSQDGCPVTATSSPSAEAERDVATTPRRVPEMMPKVLGLPSRNRRNCCTSAPERVPDRLRCVTRSSRNRSEVDDSCVQTGCPVAEGASPAKAEAKERSATAAPRRGARLPKVRHRPRPKPRKDPQQLRPDGCPVAEAASPNSAETEARSTTTAPTRGALVPKVHHPIRPKPKQGPQQLRPDGARIPKPLHPPGPKPRRDPQQQRSDGCPMTEAASPPKAEAEKRSATAALGRVPDDRSRFTPQGRSREEIHNSSARTGARMSKARHPLQPKP